MSSTNGSWFFMRLRCSEACEVCPALCPPLGKSHARSCTEALTQGREKPAIDSPCRGETVVRLERANGSAAARANVAVNRPTIITAARQSALNVDLHGPTGVVRASVVTLSFVINGAPLLDDYG